MKKRIILCLATLALFGGSLTVAFNSPSATAVRAEGETSSEVTFQKKTYTYTSEQGVATLTLVSETEYSLVMVAADGQTISGEGTYVRTGNIIELNANGNVMKIQVSDITMTFGEVTEPAVDEEAEKEKWYTVASEWIENKVIPLLGGFSIASVVSSAIAVITAITKAKGDKNNRVIIKEQDDKIAKLTATVDRLEEKLAKREEYEAKMFEQFVVTFSNTSATMETVSNYAKSIVEQVSAQNIKIDHVAEMKQSIEVSCTLISKALALSEVAVKSGIAEDAQKLIATFEGGNSDGGTC